MRLQIQAQFPGFSRPKFMNERLLLLKNVSRLIKDKLPACDTSVIKLHLYRDDLLSLVTSTLILDTYVEFLMPSEICDSPLLQDYYILCK